MPRVRAAGLISLLTAGVAALALTGVAVATVASADCQHPGYYVQNGGHTELVGGCLVPADGRGLLPDPVTSVHPAGTAHSALP